MTEASNLAERIKSMAPSARLRLAANLLDEARKQQLPQCLSTLEIARSIAESVQLEIGAALLAAQLNPMTAPTINGVRMFAGFPASDWLTAQQIAGAETDERNPLRAVLLMRDGRRNGIYTASKTRHADKWIELRAAGVPVVSTWIDEAGPGQSVDLSDLWNRCIDEASNAAALIIYREPDDVLKGAFIEVGVALASGVSVFAVGCDGQSFTNHRLVTCCNSVEVAVAMAMREVNRAAAERLGK